VNYERLNMLSMAIYLGAPRVSPPKEDDTHPASAVLSSASKF